MERINRAERMEKVKTGLKGCDGSVISIRLAGSHFDSIGNYRIRQIRKRALKNPASSLDFTDYKK
jgi:hypothetical protein